MKHPDAMRCTQRIDRNDAVIDLCMDIESIIGQGASIDQVLEFVGRQHTQAHLRLSAAILDRRQAWKAYGRQVSS